MSKTSFLWITDPWPTLDLKLDTTLRLAQEAANQGYPSYWADVKTIRLERGQILLDATPVHPSGKIIRDRPKPVSPTDFESIHYRTDPPIDLAYLHPLQLLSLGVQNHPKARIINSPEALALANDKFEAQLLGDLLPPCVVSSQADKLEGFLRAQKKAVLKPLFEAQSKGVELLEWTSAAARKKSLKHLSRATDRFTRPALLQKYLPSIRKEGETRLWFLDGQILACAKKLPILGDFRVNIDGGSLVKPLKLTAGLRSVASRIGKQLKKREIRMAAVDLIEGYVTDFNVTSPGLLVQMEKALEVDLAARIIRALART